MDFITKFGDMALLLPLSCVLAVALWRWETRDAARSFSVALFGCLAVMLALKLLFLSCAGLRGTGIASPSGHAALSTLVFGSFAMVIAAHAPRSTRRLVLGGAAALVAAIALSRIAIGVHTGPEVAMALLVGGSALGFFSRRYSPRNAASDRPRLRLRRLWAAIGVVLVLLYGVKAPAELVIRKAATLIRVETGGCAWPR